MRSVFHAECADRRREFAADPLLVLKWLFPCLCMTIIPTACPSLSHFTDPVLICSESSGDPVQKNGEQKSSSACVTETEV